MRVFPVRRLIACRLGRRALSACAEETARPKCSRLPVVVTKARVFGTGRPDGKANVNRLPSFLPWYNCLAMLRLGAATVAFCFSPF